MARKMLFRGALSPIPKRAPRYFKVLFPRTFVCPQTLMTRHILTARCMSSLTFKNPTRVWLCGCVFVVQVSVCPRSLNADSMYSFWIAPGKEDSFQRIGVSRIPKRSKKKGGKWPSVVTTTCWSRLTSGNNPYRGSPG